MTKNIEGFDPLLSAYSGPISTLARELVAVVLETHPNLTSKVLTGWRAIGFSDGKAGYVCGVFLQQHRVQLLFEHGRLLSDPEKVLQGNTKQTRFIGFAPGDSIPVDIVGLYIAEAIALKLV